MKVFLLIIACAFATRRLRTVIVNQRITQHGAVADIMDRQSAQNIMYRHTNAQNNSSI